VSEQEREREKKKGIYNSITIRAERETWRGDVPGVQPGDRYDCTLK